MDKKREFETEAIRNQIERSGFGEHTSAMYVTSSFVFDYAEDMRASFAEEKEKNIYSRFSNPNNTEFVNKIVAMEGAESGYGYIFDLWCFVEQWGPHPFGSFGIRFNPCPVYQVLSEMGY